MADSMGQSLIRNLAVVRTSNLRLWMPFAEYSASAISTRTVCLTCMNLMNSRYGRILNMGFGVLISLEQTCFKAPLQPQEVEGIKFILRSHDPSMLQPIPSSALSSPNVSPPATPSTDEEGVTEDGFLYLHTEFIRRARVETTWVVLRQFGYAEDLKLTEGWLSPK